MVSGFVGAAWNAYKKNFWTVLAAKILEFVIVGAVALIFLALVIALFIPGLLAVIAGGAITPAAILSLILHSIPALIVAVIGLAIVVILLIEFEAGLVGIYADSLKGKANLETMFSTMKDKFWAILGANAIVFLIAIAMILFLLLPSAALLMVMPLVAIALLIIVVIIMILIMLLFSVANQSVVVGGKSAVGAIEESVKIVKSNYLSAFALMLIFIVINVVLQAIGLVPILSIIVLIIILLIVAPLQVISFTAFYNEKSEQTTVLRPAPKPVSKTARKKR